MDKVIEGVGRVCCRQGLSLALDAELEDKVSDAFVTKLVRFPEPNLPKK